MMDTEPIEPAASTPVRDTAAAPVAVTVPTEPVPDTPRASIAAVVWSFLGPLDAIRRLSPLPVGMKFD